MCGEEGFIAVRETVRLVKFIGKGCSIFFSSACVTLLSTTGYNVLKYSSRIHMDYLAAQQQNKLIKLPVCANVGVLFTLDILRYMLRSTMHLTRPLKVVKLYDA